MTENTSYVPLLARLDNELMDIIPDPVMRKTAIHRIMKVLCGVVSE
jgi:hypothetical protein